MSCKTYDAVVAGGGFAGLACARTMSRQGMQVLVLEKKQWPGTKSHTTGIIVKELAEAWNVPRRLTRKITHIRLYSPDLEYLDLYSPDYYFFATDTPSLLRWHADQAIQSGVTIRYNSGYHKSSYKNGYHLLESANISGRYLVGCDGARSRVATNYRLGRNTQFLLGSEIEIPVIPGMPDSCLHVFLDNEIAPGYIAWAVPGVHAWQVGLATRYPVVPDLDRFICKLRSLYDVDLADSGSRRAGLIPCGGTLKRFYAPGVLLLGDAAGMVSPLTAGGIHPAVNIAEVAGEMIVHHILYGGEDPGSELRRELPGFSYKKKIRYLYDHIPASNQLLNYLIHTPAFRLAAQAIFFHNRGLFSLNAWRDIIRATLQH